MLHKFSRPIWAFSVLFITFTLQAQQKPKAEFGKVTMQDLNKMKYEIDSTADAVVLFEKATTYFTYDERIGFVIETEIFIRKKILKPSAFELGIVKIPIYRDTYDKSQVLKYLKANTFYLENGTQKKVELTKKDIFEEKITDKYFNTKLTFPNVKEGSIIEYSYTIASPFQVRDKPKTWYFQGSRPTLWSEVDITIPSHFYYQIISGGYLELALNTQEKATVNMGHSQLDTYGTRYNFAVQNAPAFQNEAFISSLEDYVSKVEFELSRVNIPNQPLKNFSLSWEDINRTLLASDSFGGRLRKSNYLKNTVNNFAAITNKKEKLERVYYYLSRQMETDDNYSSIFADDLKKVFENKKGTPTEQNLILTSLLREMGFNANPVILSTRDNGKVNQHFPLLDKFNYTICRVELDGVYYNLDISDATLKMGMLPYDCLNGDGREINDAGGQFVNFSSNEKYKSYESIDAKIDLKSGKIFGKMEQSNAGYKGHSLRKEFKKIGAEKMKESLKKDMRDIKILNITLENMEDQDKLQNIKMDFELQESIGDEDILYISPIFSGKMSENPFKQPERAYPVDFGYGSDYTYKLTLEIPKEFTVESLPKNTNTTLADKSGQFIFSSTFDAATNKINLMSKIMIRNPVYYAEQYHELRELYNRIIQKQEEQIVLKRK